MEINPLPKSSITQARPAAGVAVVGPPPKAAAPKPVAKAPEPKKDAGAAVAAAKGTEGTKTEITDVKPTGDANAEGDPTFTLKVNGKEYKATQSEIIALAQKARGAEAAMKKASELEKLSTNLLENFDTDVFKLMVQRHGKEKAKELAIGMVKNLIAEEAKDPKDLELDDLRAKNKEHEAAQERTKKEAEEAQRKVKQQQLYKQMLTEIDTELNNTHLPKDKLTLTRVLNYLAAGKKTNGATWTIKDAVQAVETEDMGHISYYAKRFVEGKLTSEKFRELFGDEALKKLNKEQINLLKNADRIAKNDGPKPEAAGETPQKKRTLSKNKGAEGMSEREWRREHGSLGGI